MTELAWDGKAERVAGDRPADAGGYFEEEVAGQVTATFLRELGDGLVRLFAL